MLEKAEEKGESLILLPFRLFFTMVYDG